MNVILVVAVLVAVTNAEESAFGAGRDLAGSLLKILENSERDRAVVVENWSGQPVRLWCASGDDRIRRDGKDYVDLNDQEAMGWSFTPNVLPGFSGHTLFWCTFCYKSERRGWNVYDEDWEKMDENGVPENGLCRWRIIDDSVRWEDDPVKEGWDFASWPSQGDC